jgi:RND family efflux transporter MFP subunit
MNSPWTRDGKVRADVINIASDVSGKVVSVAVRDDQLVHKGDILFSIDPKQYQFSLANAEARLASRKVNVQMSGREAERRENLEEGVVSVENRERAVFQSSSAEAAYREAEAEVALAKLNLERTNVRSPIDGYITNLNVHPGDYANVGVALLAVIDKNSFWVNGYFEETKLHLIKEGDPVEIRLMNDQARLNGEIQSIAHGISDRENATGKQLLSDVNPTFTWVRLAQRVPVRIRIKEIPDNLHIAAGMTCTVIVKPSKRK